MMLKVRLGACLYEVESGGDKCEMREVCDRRMVFLR